MDLVVIFFSHSEPNVNFLVIFFVIGERGDKVLKTRLKFKSCGLITDFLKQKQKNRATILINT